MNVIPKKDFATFATKLLCFFVFMLGIQELKAQTPNSYLFEPTFEVNFESESPWSYTLSVANRALLTQRLDGKEISDSKNIHIELSGFTRYQVTENAKISVGARYRFREIYDELNQDRFKLVEEYKYSVPNSVLNFSHRGRLEQKFRQEGEIFSFRYQLGISQALSEVFELGLSTEALYHISKHAKPGAEQRLSLDLVNSSLKNIELETGIEYRLENYNNDPENAFFLLAGVVLNL